MTRRKPGLVLNFGVILIVGWALAVSASGPSSPELYRECCARCHGETGHGDGPYADELPNRPRNFTDCKTMAAIPDAVLFKAIKKGGPAVGLPDSMPSWEAALEDDQILELIHYVRHFCDHSAVARDGAVPLAQNGTLSQVAKDAATITESR